MAFSLYKRFSVPNPISGGTKSFRLFLPGAAASVAVGVAGFVWLLVQREWAAAPGGLALGLVANLAIMGAATPPNKRLYDAVDQAVADRSDRTLALTVWFESYFLHAAKALTIFLAFASPVFLLRGGEAHHLAAALLGLFLAAPPQSFLVEEAEDVDWHATFRPFCSYVPVVLAVGAGVWHLPLWSLVGPFAVVTLGSAALMARFNLRRYRAKMAAGPAAPAKRREPPARSQASPDEIARLAAMPGARIEVELKEAPRRKKRLPPGAFRVGGEVRAPAASPPSRRHASRRSKGRR